MKIDLTIAVKCFQIQGHLLTCSVWPEVLVMLLKIVKLDIRYLYCKCHFQLSEMKNYSSKIFRN